MSESWDAAIFGERVCIKCNAYFSKSQCNCELCGGNTVKFTDKFSLVEFEKLMRNHNWTFAYTSDLRFIESTDAVTKLILSVAHQSPEHMELFEKIENEKWSGK